jgi:ribosomal protein S18 acetylase RimI-like enzyme
MTALTYEYCDFSNPSHQEAVAFLLNHYMEDPMGDHTPLTASEHQKLAESIERLPHAFILLQKLDEHFVGMVTCFELFSTFEVKPYLYIHDVIVYNDYRGQKLGRKLMERIIGISRERGCCKITLEVREDNKPALNLYQSLGFEDCDPKMYFWTKKL